MKLSQKKQANNEGVLLFGPPKSGKTELVGKLSEYFNLTYIDLENGFNTLFKLPDEWQERIELIALPDSRGFPIAAETCPKILKGPVEICELHGKVKCILCRKEEAAVVTVDVTKFTADDILVFDSLTQLTNSMIAHITKNQPEDYKLLRDDWGQLSVLIDTFLSYIQVAPYHRICISHESMVELPNKKSKLVPVAGSSNFSRNSAKFFDHVVYAEIKNRKHSFASSTAYATNIMTGSRTDVVMEDAEVPSLLAIFKPEVYVGRGKPVRAASQTSSILQGLKNK